MRSRRGSTGTENAPKKPAPMSRAPWLTLAHQPRLLFYTYTSALPP